ncbi:hypothetical protein [Botrimarina sp.]|uniref:hypothetical protein n=1 Tax=Botrimarina sp. TaxID=2795802 RepID=UPI0032EFE495
MMTKLCVAVAGLAAILLTAPAHAQFGPYLDSDVEYGAYDAYTDQGIYDDDQYGAYDAYYNDHPIRDDDFGFDERYGRYDYRQRANYGYRGPYGGTAARPYATGTPGYYGSYYTTGWDDDSWWDW